MVPKGWEEFTVPVQKYLAQSFVIKMESHTPTFAHSFVPKRQQHALEKVWDTYDA